MVVTYCYLERKNYIVLEIRIKISLTLKQDPLFLKPRPLIGTVLQSFEIK